MSTVFPSPVHHPINPDGRVTHCGWETLRVVFPVTDSAMAVMVVLPDARALASPEALMVATVAAEEDQVTEVLVSFVLPSL